MPMLSMSQRGGGLYLTPFLSFERMYVRLNCQTLDFRKICFTAHLYTCSQDNFYLWLNMQSAPASKSN